MKEIKLAKDVVPLGEFKANAPKWLERARKTGRPFMITRNGRPAGVVMSPEEYDEMTYDQRFRESIAEGMAAIERGEVYTTAQVRAMLEKRRKARR